MEPVDFKKKKQGEPILDGNVDQIRRSRSMGPIGNGNPFQGDGIEMDDFAHANQQEQLLRQDEAREQEIRFLGSGSYIRQTSEDGDDLGFSTTAEKRIQSLTGEINRYIDGNYTRVMENKFQDAGYEEPKGLAQKAKTLVDKKAKVQASEKKSANRDFDEMYKVQMKLRFEGDRFKKLALKEEIITRRNRGLRSFEKATSTDKLATRGKTADLLLSEKMELVALYQSELNELDRERGENPDYGSQSKNDYAKLLKEKIEETKEIVQKKEVRRKDLNLAELLSEAYDSGKDEYYEKYNEIQKSLEVDIEEEDKKQIVDSCKADATAFAEKKLEMKAVTDDKGKVTFTDSIGLKYKTILSMDFTLVGHFEATETSFEQMHKDIETIGKEKAVSYKECEAAIETATKKKEEIVKNPALTDEEKNEQKKQLDKQIEEVNKRIAVIELELNQLLKYDFFGARIKRLHERFSAGSVPYIMADLNYIFDPGPISFKNYDYSRVGRIKLAKRVDDILGRQHSTEYYNSLLKVDEEHLNEEDKRAAKRREVVPDELLDKGKKRKEKEKDPKQEKQAEEQPKEDDKADE